MTVKLRLMRMGKKKQPTYRVVVADSRSPRNGRFIEALGTYAPRMEPSAIEIDNDRALDWLTKGAQPTETVHKLLVISGAWEQFESTRPPKKAPAPRVRPGHDGASAKKASAAKGAAKKALAKKAPPKKAPAKLVEAGDAATGTDQGDAEVES